MRAPRRRAVVVSTAALAIAAALCACHKPTASAAGTPALASGEQPLTVSVAPVQIRSLSGGVEASGLLVPQFEAAVTTELNGYRVRQVLVDEDARVSAGQPLAVLDDTLLHSMIVQQRAVVSQQRVAAERAQAEADRVKDLDNAGVLPQEQIAERRLAAKSGVATVAAAQAQLDDLATREGLMTVRAPVGGLVLARTVRPGDVASPSLVMFRIASGDVIELNAEVPESDLGRIRVGDTARVTLPGGTALTGRVRVISPEVDQLTKLGHVRITLPLDPLLRPGGFARASFVDSRRDAAVVPEEAIHFDADGPSVMVLGADDHVHRTPIVTGVRSGGWVELVKGPPAGAKVLLSGGSFVLDGDKVRPNFVGKAAT